MRNNRLVENLLLGVVFGYSLFQTELRAEQQDGGQGVGGAGSQQEKPRKDRAYDKKPPLAEMSPEDREAVRKALQAVWENPEVLQARDEVKRATEAFHKAIRKALGQQDPLVAEMVEKMHGGGKPGDWENRGSGPGDRPVGKPPVRNERGSRPSGTEGRGIGPAGMLAFHGDYSKEEKAHLEEVRKKAMESEEFKRVQEELKALLKQGEDLRRKRVELFHQTREEITKAMIKVDPEVEPLLERMQKRKKGE
jgi:hypothetical protein